MYTPHRILVPTDFSIQALAAVDHAMLLATRFQAEVTLLHVDEFSVSPLGALGIRAAYVDTYQQKKREFLEQQMESLVRRMNSSGVRIHMQIAQGSAYKVIIELSENEDFDLVVIAARGLTGLSTHLMGSTAERVVRLCRQPVLSVQGPPVHRGSVSSVLCPTDLSPAANVALLYSLSIAHQYGATLYIQYISELEKPEAPEQIRKKFPALTEILPEAAQVRTEYVLDRDVEPSNSIIRFAEDRDVSMIVMSTHGRKGIRRVYIGNNTAEVVRKSTRPVLTMSHPLHKQMFSRPVTQQSPLTVPESGSLF